ncbi:MAG: DNA polymerase III subunit delta [Gammaproteobacteria bacterium]|nr:DNA polymerase III subunit delta [Gammaproteobacteria bacterium]
MRVAIQSLSDPDGKDLEPVYLLFGSEILILEEASDALRKRARQQGYTERECFVVEQGFDWGALLQSGSSLSLFDEKRLIELRIPTGKPGQVGSRMLVELSENFPPDTLLMVICGPVDRAGQKQKWFKALDAAGISAEAKEVKLADFPGWLSHRLRHKGLLPDQPSIELLTHYFEGNLLAVAQEIDLLALNISSDNTSLPDAKRQLAVLQSSVSDNSRFSVFSYLDACLAGDWQRTNRIIDALRAEKNQSVFLIVMLGREVRRLIQMASALAGGANKGQVFRQYKVWGADQHKIEGAIKRHDRDQWQQILQQIAKLDKIAKGRAGSEGASIWFDIEKLSMKICGLKII